MTNDMDYNYYGDGRDAYRNGLALDSYPEGLISEQKAEWQDGWLEVEAEEEAEG